MYSGGMKVYDLSPAKLAQSASVKRFQVYLDIGVYPESICNKTWDMLEWIDAQKSS